MEQDSLQVLASCLLSSEEMIAAICTPYSTKATANYFVGRTTLFHNFQKGLSLLLFFNPFLLVYERNNRNGVILAQVNVR